MAYAFIDTETTGLPVRINGHGTPDSIAFPQSYEACRMVQLSCVIYTPNKRMYYDYVVHPSYDFEIPNAEFHGVTQKKAEDEGFTWEYIHDLLYQEFKKHDVKEVLAYNINFDMNVIQHECHVAKLDNLMKYINSCKKTDVMILSQDFMKVKKWPKLDEIYKHLFGVPRSKLLSHNSLIDIEDTVRCWEFLQK